MEFLIGAILDQTVVADRAWSGAPKLRRRLGHLNPARLAATPLPAIERAIRGAKGESLHRFPARQARYVRDACALLAEEYGGDPGNLWADGLTVAEIRDRLLEISGIGPKIANMTVRILLEDHGVHARRLEALDVAVDRHVARVLFRTGYISAAARGRDGAAVRNEAVAAARRLLPGCPGALDFPAIRHRTNLVRVRLRGLLG